MHEIRIIGLEAFTEYSFKVRSTDTYSIVGESKILPLLQKPHYQKLEI